MEREKDRLEECLSVLIRLVMRPTTTTISLSVFASQNAVLAAKINDNNQYDKKYREHNFYLFYKCKIKNRIKQGNPRLFAGNCLRSGGMTALLHQPHRKDCCVRVAVDERLGIAQLLAFLALAMPLFLAEIVIKDFCQQGVEILGSHGEVDAVEVEYTRYGYPILAGLVEETDGKVLKTDTQTTEIVVGITHGKCRNACFVG